MGIRDLLHRRHIYPHHTLHPLTHPIGAGTKNGFLVFICDCPGQRDPSTSTHTGLALRARPWLTLPTAWIRTSAHTTSTIYQTPPRLRIPMSRYVTTLSFSARR